jgi:hypothetical protein
MITDLVKPPNTKKELFEKLAKIVHHGRYQLPEQGFGGSGGPGLFLENLLGLTTGNKDIPDSIGWELKFYSQKTNLITLFHKEPQPSGVLRYLVSKYGWKDKNGCLSFRHTISGKSDRFQVFGDANQITVRPIHGNGGPVPYWTDNDILSAAGAKLRRLVLVRGEKNGNTVVYDRIDVYENLGLPFFIYEVVNGTIKIDFDARELKPGSIGLRNHGTKFRVEPGNICRLFDKKDRIA